MVPKFISRHYEICEIDETSLFCYFLPGVKRPEREDDHSPLI